MQLNYRHRQQGFTLIELLIASAISLVVVAGLIGLLLMSTNHSQTTIGVGRLESQLRLVLNAMTTDIQRAGYWANADSSATNPFMVTGTTDLTINGAQNCILMTYDHDNDGALPAVSSASDDERYGYRLMNNAIQYRPRGANFDCAAGANVWENLTDPNAVTITAFVVTLNSQTVDIDDTGPGTATIVRRSVSISITGELTHDTSVTKTLQTTVKVYNDKYNP